MHSAQKITQKINEIQQKKKRRWHIRDPELRDAVRYCVMMRLTEKESLDELSKRGYGMSYRTFRRIKSSLEPNKQRLDKIIQQDFLLHVVTAIDTVEFLKERLLEMLKNSPNVSEQIKIISEIRQISKDKLELYDSSSVIATLLRLEKKKSNGHVEEPTESS